MKSVVPPQELRELGVQVRAEFLRYIQGRRVFVAPLVAGLVVMLSLWSTEIWRDVVLWSDAFVAMLVSWFLVRVPKDPAAFKRLVQLNFTMAYMTATGS